MSWLDEAKKRVEKAREIYRESTSGAYDCMRAAQEIVDHDAPRAYALLERAKKQLVAYKRLLADVNADIQTGYYCSRIKRVEALLHDLEGKEETDG